MSFLDGSSKSLTKRGLLRSAGMFTAGGVLMGSTLARGATTTIDVTAAPFGASQSKADNSAAFQAALNAIAANGGGHLYVPGGDYQLGTPLVYKGRSLTVEGEGQSNTVLVNTHSGTVLTAYFGDNSSCLTVKDLGFSPCSGRMAQGAIAIVLPAQPSGWQNALIQDVCIGVPYALKGAQYTSYGAGIALINTNRARINNVNVHANSVKGGIAIALGGTCYDTRVLGCSLEGYSHGVSVLSYSEGLHLKNNVIICDTAITTGSSNFNTSGLAINLLELLMMDCEINTNSECLSLYQVKNAQITNCHFTGPKIPNAESVSAIDMHGCSESLIKNCTFDGSWAPGGPTTVGIGFNPSGRAPTTSCHVSDVQFENTMVAIFFGGGAVANTATNVELLAPGTGALVNGILAFGNQAQHVYVDVSGNTTNNVSWLTSANTATAIAGKRSGSQN